MNDYWSQYVQTTDELYRSRALRFHDGNKELWLMSIGAQDGMNILEVGCAGGLFCHRIKTYLPHTQVTGLDFDTGHIAYAQAKTKELNLDCRFVNGDALEMPFADDTFDLCFSHTVIEHLPTMPFLREQRRVLKPGGRISVLSARTRLSLRDNNWFITSKEEKALSDKLWQQAEKVTPVKNIGAYELSETDFPKALEQAGFREVDVGFITVTDYAPDNAFVPDETALEQIECHRRHSLAAAEKPLRLAPEALTASERQEFFDMINRRYDERIRLYQSGEKLWDFSNTTVLFATGKK